MLQNKPSEKKYFILTRVGLKVYHLPEVAIPLVRRLHLLLGALYYPDRLTMHLQSKVLILQIVVV
jgi:hypothetical protein